MQSLPRSLAAGAALFGCAGGLFGAENDADNTGRNARDQDQSALTATDQSNDPKALELVAAIRKLVVADDNLSALAKNAKIITDAQGRATLRGLVESSAEKSRIATLAREAGAQEVTNELEIKKTN